METKSRGPELVAVSILMLALSLIFSLLRLYARAFIVKQIGSDDYLAFASFLCFAMMCITCIVAVEYGMGKKGVDIPDLLTGGAVNALLWWWMAELWYLMAGLLLKLSMGIFLLRIATQRTVRITIYAIMTATILATSYFILQFIFQCWPVEYFWKRINFLVPMEGKCVSEDLTLKSAYAYSAVTCAVDFSLCLIPLFLVSKLQLNRRTKISVMGVLSLWCVASVTTFIRLPYLRGLKGDQPNFLYNTSDLAIWSLCETGISIICIATATLRPLMAKSFFKSSASESRTNNDTYNTHSRSRSGHHWAGSSSAGIGSPRGNKGYIRSGSGSKVMTIDEEIGQAMGSDSESMEMQKRPGLVVSTVGSDVHDGNVGRHGHSRSYNEAMGMGTTTYVRGGEAKSVDEREGQGEAKEADFVYGYGIRATTVVTTQRERGV